MNIWNKLKRNEFNKAEDFLREREAFCASAVSRFRDGSVNKVWAAFSRDTDAGGATVSALLLYCKRLLYPVFCFPPDQREQFKTKGMPLPLFCLSLLQRDSLHAAQGIADDMDMMESALEKKGIVLSSKYNYELLDLEYSGGNAAIKTPPGLVIRRAEPSDTAALFPLQAAYEKEEVLPPGADFNPAVCRKSLEVLINKNMMMVAELEGNVVGKININASAYKRFQIGGVYVLPEYRSRGIARAMTSSLIREFAPEKKQFSLFVKKTNIPARRAYDSLGFVKSADYRISYYR